MEEELKKAKEPDELIAYDASKIPLIRFAVSNRKGREGER